MAGEKDRLLILTGARFGNQNAGPLVGSKRKDAAQKSFRLQLSLVPVSRRFNTGALIKMAFQIDKRAQLLKHLGLMRNDELPDRIRVFKHGVPPNSIAEINTYPARLASVGKRVCPCQLTLAVTIERICQNLQLQLQRSWHGHRPIPTGSILSDYERTRRACRRSR